MNPDKVNSLIEQIWSIQARIRIISDDLTRIDNAIAHEVPDDR